MKAVIQRVRKASVEVDGEVITSIGRGICVLVGISRDDTKKDMDFIVRKLLNLRIFEDDGKRWCHSVKDKQYEILLVSQFTLCCAFKGNKPNFHLAMDAEKSESFYKELVENVRQNYKPDLVKDGKFGVFRNVKIENDGPVTITIESASQGTKEIADQLSEAVSGGGETV